jgi:hypothetical protein
MFETIKRTQMKRYKPDSEFSCQYSGKFKKTIQMKRHRWNKYDLHFQTVFGNGFEFA